MPSVCMRGVLPHNIGANWPTGLRMTQFRCCFGSAKILIINDLSKFELDLTSSLLFIEITFF